MSGIGDYTALADACACTMSLLVLSQACRAASAAGTGVSVGVTAHTNEIYIMQTFPGNL